MTELEEKINRAIKDANFNFLERMGFEANCDLALIAGAAIGYRLGVEDTGRGYEQIIEKFKEQEFLRKCRT